MGWRLVIVDEGDCELNAYAVEGSMRLHHPHEYVLENEVLRAVIDPTSGSVREITDKRTGAVAAVNAGVFGLTESTHGGMTAWVVARYKNDEAPVMVDRIEWAAQGPLRNTVKVTGRYGDSKVSYTLSLDQGAETLMVSAEVDWLEHGSPEKGVPQLRFSAGHASTADAYLYDIPFGSITRPATDMDVPGLSYACSQPVQGPALAILSRDKYGYRCTDSYMSLTLIRSSDSVFGTDPYPENVRHRFAFHIALPRECNASYMTALSKRLCHPAFSRSVTKHEGTLPAELSLLESGAAISGIKAAEDGSGDAIVRLYDETGETRTVFLKLAVPIEAACLCSLTEKPGQTLAVSGNDVTVPVPAFGIASVRIRFGRSLT